MVPALFFLVCCFNFYDFLFLKNSGIWANTNSKKEVIMLKVFSWFRKELKYQKLAYGNFYSWYIKKDYKRWLTGRWVSRPYFAMYWVQSDFCNVTKVKTYFANLNFCGSFQKKFGSDQKKAGNRYEEIPSVAYRYSFKCSFDYICISGISRLTKAFKYY